MTKTKTHTKPTKPAIDREAVRMLVIEFGPREAARKLGLNENTVLGWAHRYEWNSPRLKQNKGAIKRAQSIKMQSTPAEALIAHHKGLEGTTKTALMQTLAKAAQQVAGKEALDITNPAQLQALCLAAARIFGWKGDSHVNVEVNNQVGIVISEAKRKEMQAQLRAVQNADDSKKQGCAPLTLASAQTQSQGNVVAGNSLPGAPATPQTSVFIMPGGEGVEVSPDTLRP
jgi:hypothetical protein